MLIKIWEKWKNTFCHILIFVLTGMEVYSSPPYWLVLPLSLWIKSSTDIYLWMKERTCSWSTNIAVHGSAHKFIRGSLLSLVGTAAIKDQLFQILISSWELFWTTGMAKPLTFRKKPMRYIITILGV